MTRKFTHITDKFPIDNISISNLILKVTKIFFFYQISHQYLFVPLRKSFATKRQTITTYIGFSAFVRFLTTSGMKWNNTYEICQLNRQRWQENYPSLVQIWNDIPHASFNTLVVSMRRRCRVCTNATNGHTKYWFREL